MRVTVNWPTVDAGLIVLVVAVTVAVAYFFVQARRIDAAKRQQRRAFERQMATAELPAYNGDTYEWTPDSLAYLSEARVYAGPGVADTAALPALTEEQEADERMAAGYLPRRPVPPSTVSGPLPVMPPLEPGDYFIAQLRAENAAFLANLEAL